MNRGTTLYLTKDTLEKFKELKSRFEKEKGVSITNKAYLEYLLNLHKKKLELETETVKRRAKPKEEIPKPPDEFPLMSDEELVVTLLKEYGTLYQSEIVRRTGFSKSKVSGLLSSMEDAEEIERMRMGRKNLVKLK